MNMQRVSQVPAYNVSGTPQAYNQGYAPRQIMNDSYRQSYKQIDKENSYAELQKRKMQQVYPVQYQSQHVLQKPEARPSSTQPRQPSLQPVPRPSSASTDKRSYSNQKQPRSSFKDLKNSAYIQPTQGYQQRYYSMKQSDGDQKPIVKSQSNQQLQGVKQNDQQEYKKLHEKLQFLESKIGKIKSNIDISNAQLQKQSDRSKQRPIGLAAKFFSKKEEEAPTPKQSICLDQFVTQVKPTPSVLQPTKQVTQQSQQPIQIKAQQQPAQPAQTTTQPSAKKNPLSLATTISNLLTKVNRHQSLEINQNASGITEKSYSSSKPVKEELFQYYISSIIKAYCNPQPTAYDELVKDHLLQTVQGLEYARNLKLQFSDDKIQHLPKSNFSKTIIFDLDETLIHCNESPQVPGDILVPITFPTGDTVQASINIRPFAQQILQTLSRHYEIIVFTASHSCYANVVLDYLDPKRQWISHRFFRESCVQSEEGAYIKDLRVIGNRKQTSMLLVDNASYSFGHGIENGVPIIAFYDNKQDQELLYLQNYLMKFRTVANMSEFNMKNIKMNQYTEFSDGATLLQTLFSDYLPK